MPPRPNRAWFDVCVAAEKKERKKAEEEEEEEEFDEEGEGLSPQQVMPSHSSTACWASVYHWCWWGSPSHHWLVASCSYL